MAVGVAGQTISVLVVEDDQAVAELLRALINQMPGWGATVVHDAAAALEVFKHVHVEALVLDVNLPGLSGLDLLDLLARSETWQHPPVILTSALPDQPAINHAVARWPNVRFVPKPFDVDDVLRALGDAIAPAQHRESPPAEPPQPAASQTAAA